MDGQSTPDLRGNGRIGRGIETSQGELDVAAAVSGHTHWHRERLETFLSGEIAPIALEDHTLDQADESGALWARCVSVDSYHIVGSSGISGSYVVWTCTVDTIDVGLSPSGYNFSITNSDIKGGLMKIIKRSDINCP